MGLWISLIPSFAAIVLAAVFSGGTFGDVTPPLSGMAAMSSGIA
ncbi:MAG TPA: hypothetical protein VFC58_07870 [Desulfosporosinus sp.]|nr:hypothetical protein [Desulfosporosinus sp.]